jgi:DUF971 family protein
MAEIESSIFIRIIRQKDHYWFTIEWSDGKVSDYHLSSLQRHCPCARCRDERYDRAQSSAEERPPLDDNVTATRIVSVGNYALQIFFTKGCSKGIYPFRLLRQVHHKYEI